MDRSIRCEVTCKVEYEIIEDAQFRGVAIVLAWFGDKPLRLGWVSQTGTSVPGIPTDAIRLARGFLDSLSDKAKPHDNDTQMDPDMEITRVDVPRSNPSWPIPTGTIP